MDVRRSTDKILSVENAYWLVGVITTTVSFNYISPSFGMRTLERCGIFFGSFRFVPNLLAAALFVVLELIPAQSTRATGLSNSEKRKQE
jgi:hypothetical protein